jgi:hypothetical protein
MQHYNLQQQQQQQEQRKNVDSNDTSSSLIVRGWLEDLGVEVHTPVSPTTKIRERNSDND